MHSRFIMWGGAVAMAIAGAVLWRMAPAVEAPGPSSATSSEAPLPEVAVLQVEPRAVREQVSLTATIEPVQRAELAAEVAGRILEIPAREHDAVAREEVLVVIDDALPRAALARTRASVERARSTARLADLERERIARLFRDGITSQAEMDIAENRAREAAGALAEAIAARDEAREIFDRTRIRAPFDGILSRLDRDPGDRLEVGAPVGEVLDLSTVELELGVNERQVLAIEPGAPVELRVTAHAGESFPARVVSVGRAVDPRSRRFPVRVQADNPKQRLLPGMVADVLLSIGDEHPALRIPRRATIEEFALTYVFVVDRSRDPVRAERRRIRTRPVPFQPTLTEVVSGLAPGEWIVGRGLRELRDGAAVRVEDEA